MTDVTRRLESEAAQAIAESNGLSGPNQAEIAAGKAAVARLLRTLGAMTEEEVVDAAAQEVYAYCRGLFGSATWEALPDRQREHLRKLVRTAAPLLGARQAAEIQELRDELNDARLFAPPNVFGAHTMDGLLSDAAAVKSMCDTRGEIIATLRAQLTTAEGQLHLGRKAYAELLQRAAAAELRAEALEKAFSRYADHAPGCYGGELCSCGLTATRTTRARPASSSEEQEKPR
jgi:hypothetical protein